MGSSDALRRVVRNRLVLLYRLDQQRVRRAGGDMPRSAKKTVALGKSTRTDPNPLLVILGITFNRLLLGMPPFPNPLTSWGCLLDETASRVLQYLRGAHGTARGLAC